MGKNKTLRKYATGQHELICTALGVSPDPSEPGDSAYEAVCILLMKLDAIKDTVSGQKLPVCVKVKKILDKKPKDFICVRLYGTEECPTGQKNRGGREKGDKKSSH